jgi:serine/threonine protein kinase
VATFLDTACAGDQSLRLRVEELLSAHRDAGNFLGGSSVPNDEADPERPGTSLGHVGFLEPDADDVPKTDSPASDRPGTVIGPYKLLQQIGEGGMGVVYMANQEQPVRRKVALKIIRPGMDSAQVIARFEAERQALAMMDHQNIARVLDAGTTASGLR